MSRVRIPVELHRALGDYFERVWNCSFALQGEPCAASEIFHRNGFLPFIVELASRKSQRIFNRPIDAQIRPHENALLGKTVVFPEKAELPVVLLLVWAAEQMFKPAPAQTIELYPIYAYHWTPTSMRTQGAWRLPIGTAGGAAARVGRRTDVQARACANHRAVSDLCLSLDADFHAHPRRLAAAGRLSASG